MFLIRINRRNVILHQTREKKNTYINYLKKYPKHFEILITQLKVESRKKLTGMIHTPELQKILPDHDIQVKNPRK